MRRPALGRRGHAGNSEQLQPRKRPSFRRTNRCALLRFWRPSYCCAFESPPTVELNGLLLLCFFWYVCASCASICCALVRSGAHFACLCSSYCKLACPATTAQLLPQPSYCHSKATTAQLQPQPSYCHSPATVERNGLLFSVFHINPHIKQHLMFVSVYMLMDAHALSDSLSLSLSHTHTQHTGIGTGSVVAGMLGELSKRFSVQGRLNTIE